jgi:tetratricopeptide (TPR) repeat protein
VNIRFVAFTFSVFTALSSNAQKTLTSSPAIDKQEIEVNTEEKFADAQREMFVGKIDKAIKLYEELYAEDRTNSSIAFELVKAYAVKKDFFQVEKFANTALTNSPNNKWMLEYIAGYMFDNNRPGTAFNHYQKLMTLEPKEKVHYENAVNSLLKQDKTTEAIAIYNTMELKLGPLPEIYMKRYELNEMLKNDVAALKELDYLVNKYPENIKYLKTKARFLTKKNNIPEAMNLYKKVLAIDSEDTDANLAVLSKGEEKAKPNAYLMSLLPIITNQSINIDVKVKELLPYIQNLSKGDDLEVKTALLDLGDKLVLTHPDEAKAYSTHGDILMLTGDVASATTKYEKTLKLNNKNFAVWEQLMYGYLEIQNYEALSKISTSALDLFPNQAINYFFSSLCNTNKKNYIEGISIAEEGLIVSGGNKVSSAKIQAALGLAFIGKKEFDKAQLAIDKAIEISEGKYAFAYETLGDLYNAKGNSAKAKENWLKSSQLGNKSKQLMLKIQ